MSLESGNFIKDLVSSNPDGADPKSQGDDHLRLIKNVLKQQFPGFQDGVGIILSEGNLNRLGSKGVLLQPAMNIDAAMPFTGWIAVLSGTTGLLPVGAQDGDMIFNIVYDTDRIYQLYFCKSNKRTYLRMYGPTTWSAWGCLTPLGVEQQYLNYGATRLLNQAYDNNTGRPIQVIVTATGTAGVNTNMDGIVNGNIIQRVNIVVNNGSAFLQFSNSVSFIVPNGQSYSVNTNAAAVVISWVELT